MNDLADQYRGRTKRPRRPLRSRRRGSKERLRWELGEGGADRIKGAEVLEGSGEVFFLLSEGPQEEDYGGDVALR